MLRTDDVRRLIYLFDSATSINSLQLVSFFQDREPGIELVAVINEGIADDAKLASLFDRYYVVPTTFDPIDPCPMAFADVVQTAALEFSGYDDIRIIAYGEYTPLLGAKLRERFSIPGLDVKGALAFRDKLVMKSLVGKAVRVPASMPFDQQEFSRFPEGYLELLGKELEWPFVIKPVNAASALGTRVIWTKAATLDVKAALQEFSGLFEAESYIDGALFHCEIVFRDGVPLVSYCSSFNKPVIALAEGACVGSIPMPSDDPLAVRIIDFCQRALATTDILDGITHTELFLDRNGELVFLETAARCPGGRVIEAYIATHGVNLLDLDQRVKAGLPVSVCHEPRKQSAFWVVIPKRAGRLVRLCDSEFDGVCDLRSYYNIGDVLDDVANFEQVFGVALVTASSHEAALRDFNRAADAIFFEVEPVGSHQT